MKSIKIFLGCTIIFIFLPKINAEFQKEKVGVYLLYNYQNNDNSVRWVDTAFTGTAKKHTINLAGLGLKYYPAKWIFLDVSKKSLLTIPEVAKVIHTSLQVSYPALQQFDVYSLTINYVFNLKNNLGFYIGLGRNINRVLYSRYGKEDVESAYLAQCYTWVFQTGATYKISERLSLNLTVGREDGFKFDGGSIASNNYAEYNYKSPFFIEPTVTLYF